MRRETWIKLVGALATAGAALLLGQQVYAATITVTLDFDRFDDTATTGCSLREAIQTANSNAQFAGCQPSGTLGNDLIVFDAGITTVHVTRTVNSGNNNNQDGDLDVYVGNVSGTLTIVGPVTVWVQGVYDRAFDVRPDGSDLGVFTLQNVTVRGGDLRIGSSVDDPSSNAQLECVLGGGGLRANSGVQVVLEGGVVRENAASYAGGGVCAREGASLILSGTQVLSNVVGLVGGQQVNWVAGGGGIWSAGPLVVTNGQVLHNRAVLSGGFYGFAGGGGIWVITGSLHLRGGEVRNNEVVQKADAEAQGGGILVGRLDYATSPVVLGDVLIEGNRSEGGTFAYGGGVAFLQGVQADIQPNTVISGNVLSATQGAVGGGLAVGLSYWPPNYFPPLVDMAGASVRNNLATASAASIADVITPTGFGGGIFFGSGTGFTLTNVLVQGNEVRYIGPSPTNTNGFGGGVSAAWFSSGRMENVQVVGNGLHGFRFNGGAGIHTNGGTLAMRHSTLAQNNGSSSGALDAGTLGGGAYIGYGTHAHVEHTVVRENLITGTQYGSGAGFGVDGTLHLTHTRVMTNTAHQGGGFGGSGVVNARWITVTGNIASHPSYAEGGAWAGQGTVTVRNALIANNRTDAPSAGGGAIVRYGGEFHLIDSAVVANYVPATWYANGGAALLGSNSVMMITNSHILSNVVTATNGNAYVGGINVGGSNATLRLYRTELAFNRAAGANDAGGGAVGNAGTAEIVESYIHHNEVVSATNNQPTGGGAGISNGGMLRLIRSSVVGNRAAYASGINTYGAPTTHIVNSTVSGNGPAGGTGVHGVVLTGTAHLTHTTIASNTEYGLHVEAGATSLYGVLVAYHAQGDCTGWSAVATSISSLSSDITCVDVHGPAPAFQPGDPLLQPLALNGGSTPNHALSVGSAALSKVNPCGVSDDQRGVSRPTLCDVGAYERQEQIDLSLAKVAAGSVATAGVPFTYTLTISNAGPDVATNVVVTDTLSGGASFASVVASTNPLSLSYSWTGATAIFTITSIAPNSVFTVVYTVYPPTAGGSFANSAVVSSTTEPDSNTGNDGASAGSVSTQLVADLAVSKVAQPVAVQPGGVITYTIVVTNNGPSAAQNVTVTDVISGTVVGGVVGVSSGVGYSWSGNAITFTVATLNAGSAVTMVYTVTAPSTPGVVVNSVVVTSTAQDPNTSNNTLPGGGVTTTVGTATLAAFKVQTYTLGVSGRIRYGGLVTYTLTITNTGTVAASSLVLTDTLSSHLSYVSFSGTGWSCSFSAPNLVCSYSGSLNSGQSVTLTIVGRAVTAGAVVSNTATVSASGVPPVSSNTVSAQVEYRVWVPIVRRSP